MLLKVLTTSHQGNLSQLKLKLSVSSIITDDDRCIAPNLAMNLYFLA